MNECYSKLVKKQKYIDGHGADGRNNTDSIR